MTVPASDNQVQDSKTNDKDINFRKLEMKLEQERQARQQADERAAQLEKQLQDKSKPRYQDDDDDDDNEPYVEKRRLKKEFNKFSEQTNQQTDQKIDQAVQKALQKERQLNYLKENPDFENTMASDVVQRFAETHPRVANTMLNMPEGFERQKLVYETIKAMEFGKPKPQVSDIQQKIDANRRLPSYQPTGIGVSAHTTQSDFSKTGQENAYNKMKELQQRLGRGSPQ